MQSLHDKREREREKEKEKEKEKERERERKKDKRFSFFKPKSNQFVYDSPDKSLSPPHDELTQSDISKHQLSRSFLRFLLRFFGSPLLVYCLRHRVKDDFMLFATQLYYLSELSEFERTIIHSKFFIFF
jgi:hypothetical protein